MTNFQKIVVVLGSVLVLTVIALLYLQLSDKLAPKLTHDEQLAKACEQHPIECEKMRMVHAQTEAIAREAQQYGPAIAADLAKVRQVQKEYDDRFIAEGYYGDAR